jgi:hypothetical protein
LRLQEGQYRVKLSFPVALHTDLRKSHHLRVSLPEDRENGALLFQGLPLRRVQSTDRNKDLVGP